METTITSSPITKTAFDAIQAKYSAVNVGYNPIVVEKQDIYQHLLEKIISSNDSSTTKFKLKRRQTPLINAGYAIRILTISSSIKSFVTYHQIVNPTKRIQIVLVGCGMDVIGLWVHSLNSQKVTIIEIDTYEICEMKKDILSKQDLVDNWKEIQDANTKITYYSGRIVTSESSTQQDNNNPNYMLIPMDLNDVSTLDNIFADETTTNLFNTNTPTLALSELVLSYLPPESTNQLLSWWLYTFGNNNSNAFVALEPLGYDGNDKANKNKNENGVITVADGYRKDYCQKFQYKMNRGQAKQQRQQKNDLSSSMFYPIGNSVEDVNNRFQQAGCSDVGVTNLGIAGSIAAATTQSKEMTCPEIFDEHAALALHLQSYVLVSALSHHQNSDDEILFRRCMCPWKWPYPVKYARACLPILDCNNNIVYTEIEIVHETEVRELFETTYKQYTNEYPAIRKMVKGVLNKELKETSILQNDEKGTCRFSTIAQYYRALKGIFLVAVKYNNGKRMVIGCVGVRSCEAKDVQNGTMEIFRLTVHEEYRKHGIGRNLLQAAERYSKEQHCPKLVANTLAILQAASKLYVSCGYHAEKVSDLGPKLSMTTFVKELPLSK